MFNKNRFEKKCQASGANYYTPRKINIEPKNDGLEDDFPLPGVHSQVPC